MAFKLTALVLDYGPRDPGAKLLLLCLADRADKSGVCFPGRADLIARTGLSDSTITRKLRMLIRDKWLQTQKRFHTSNVFRLNVARLFKLQAEEAAKPDIPDGFEPFAEEAEVAALVAAQVVENKDNGHGDGQKGHPDGQKGHGDHVTGQKPVIESAVRVFALSDADFRRYLDQRKLGETKEQWALRVGATLTEVRANSRARIQGRKKGAEN